MQCLADAWRDCWESWDFSANKKLFWWCVFGSVMILSTVLLGQIHNAPSFQLKRLYIPALDISSSNSWTNAAIDFAVSFEIKPMIVLVCFDPINVSFCDGPNVNHTVANFTIPQFILKQKVTDKVEYIGTANAAGLDLDEARQEIETNGFKVFRMNLITSVRYDSFLFWKTKRYAYRKSVDVRVDAIGSAAPRTGNGFVGIRVLIMLNLIVAIFICS